MARGSKKSKSNQISFEQFKEEVLADFKIACESRETSLLGRREVLTGKAKFGIFGDGKEIPQLALAKSFKIGDFRSGYYRDQTFMMAIGQLTIEQFFAQLYSNTDVNEEPHSAGRQMNGHFATRSLDENGEWKELKSMKNSSSDTSPTSSQMSRAVGLALASKAYRNSKPINKSTKFSNNGNEVCFATIGDASTSEGPFWESINAAGVMQIPLAVSIWDDGYGISVPQKYQTTKEDLSEILSGFTSTKEKKGVDVMTGYAWDYAGLVQMYQEAIAHTRETHTPCIIHVKECTQPQGHSTSGSHERYKSKKRLAWEDEWDGIKKMAEWMEKNALATADELEEIRQAAKKTVRDAKKAAWSKYIDAINIERAEVIGIFNSVIAESANSAEIVTIANGIAALSEPFRRELLVAAKAIRKIVRSEQLNATATLNNWINQFFEENTDRFTSHLHSHSAHAALDVAEVKAEFNDDAAMMNGSEILNACFDYHLANNEMVFAFGEDLGKIGDVNQGFAGLQEKHGEHRVFDTGIRENTIIGQGIGMAMRGLRPIAEIQYLDYLLFGLQPLSDDLATVQYRTKGGQKAPLIVRTRGHRLEGIWHTGSPIGMILGSLRGMHVAVPRNMTQAAGFYNTLLQSDEPALVIECLNGYRLKEKLPSNIGTFTVPLGVPEILTEGSDVTLVTYGSCVRIAQDAITELNAIGISVELIDVQSLLPFDLDHRIVESLAKTNRIVFLDEDVPGGASAYMLQKVLEEQEGYKLLDSQPITLTAKPNRVAYGSDADYFSKPNKEDVFETIYQMMHEADPSQFPAFF